MSSLPPPRNSLVSPLLTDLYQITMAYAYWKSGRQDDPAVFELFFRKNPFKGEYTIFCGLDVVLKFVDNYRFSDDDITYLKQTSQLKHCESGFWDYLSNIDCSNITISALREGTVAFPRVPLIVVKGPLGVAQLLETTLLALVNYPSLVATNAARMVGAVNRMSRPSPPKCFEFGLRRAQGPDGGFSASKYSYLGGFDGTSNVLAGKLLGLNISGTHAHAFVQSFLSLEEVKDLVVLNTHNKEQDNLLSLVLEHRKKKGDKYLKTHDGELAAFIAYACAFPESFLCLIDTYDTINSGVLNFILVALALGDLGYTPRGVRLDSGDLAYFSLECDRIFKEMGKASNHPFFASLDIVASNDINEEVIHTLENQGHAITVFGIGTNLVTCQAQPALGCVYKLVELSGTPRMKISQDIEKVLIPGQKKIYRLHGESGHALVDLMILSTEEQPEVGKRFLCRHPFIERKRAAVRPTRVVELHHTAFENGKVLENVASLEESRQYVKEQLSCLRADILRPVNPTPYKVSVSSELFVFLHDLWISTTPVMELS
mmetsp:Transcript_2138/g.3163  ORF Transcript_2138/g.3163 Transcript_2138/m.3163 type:complete len:545 (-) Transcript_2138:796-2430(-)|eukprot:CAMPEP_0194203982 /NCGR_PEP_ID=MMETSP0156-20130528/3611_1 /TAXON_ID=33649 /ORGANISM="Thalassionema nitzschioides, Strain L26-B" /LENGTH=544 /DNA_ID=CAMNT_0038929861 /DNA_START=139 /DNA_END=1773 /DNA_ORIENTATION=+